MKKSKDNQKWLKEFEKKRLLVISILPFAVIILKGIYHILFGIKLSNGFVLKGFSALSEFIMNDVVLGNFFVNIFLIACLTYLAYYFISAKKGSITIKITKRLHVKLKDLVFLIGLAPIIYIVTHALFAAIFGYEAINIFTSTTIYGFDAMYDSIMIDTLTLTVIPVLPISIIYDIVYITVRFREKNNDK